MESGTIEDTATNAVSSFGAVSVVGGTIFGKNYGFSNRKNATVTISGGTISSNGVGFYNNANGKVTITGSATVTGANKGVHNDKNATVSVSGGTVSGRNTAGVFNSGNGVINISGGTVSGNSAEGVKNSSTGTVNVLGTASISSGRFGIWNSNTGKINISGGSNSINGGNAGVLNYNGTVQISSDDSTITGGSLGVWNYGSNGTINISGKNSSIYGATRGIENEATCTLNVAGEGSTISGGTYGIINRGDTDKNGYVNISGQNLSISGGTAGIQNDHMWSDLNILPDASASITGGSTGYGIFTNGTLNISLGSATSIYGGYYGIYDRGKVNIAEENSSITGGYYGIYNQDRLTVSGGIITGDKSFSVYNAVYSDSGKNAVATLSGGTYNKPLAVDPSHTLPASDKDGIGGYEITGTPTFNSNTLLSGNSTLLKYESGLKTSSGSISFIGAQGWNASETENQWFYLKDAGSSSGTKVATLAGADTTLTFSDTSALEGGIAIDIAKIIGASHSYKTLNAASAKSALKVTGDSNITAITSGESDDTLTAGAGGVTLNGGAGDDLLIGGNGADLFVATDGNDTIQGYQATDTLQLAADPSEIAFEGDNNISFTVNDAKIVVEGAKDIINTFKIGNESKSYQFVAQNGNKVYTSLETAISNASAGDTIKLLAANSETISVGKQVTIDLNGFTISKSVTVSGNLTVTDSKGGGKIETADDAVTVANGGTFNLLGGTITSSGGSAVVNNGTVNIRGGKVDSSTGRGISNQTVNSYLNMWSGSVFGKVGIKMLAGFLNLLGGRVHGRKVGAANVAENVVENEATTEDGNGGVGIDVAPSGNVEVNVGDKETKSEIEVTGQSSALSVGDGDSSSSTSTVNLNDGKYSSDDGNSITYSGTNTANKLNVDGAILENKVEVTSAAKAQVGSTDNAADGSANNIVIKSVAVASDAKTAMAATTETTSTNEIADLLAETTTKFNGGDYNFVGSTSNFFAVKVTGNGASQSNVLDNVVEYNDETDAEVNEGDYYGSLKDAASSLTADATITLLKDLEISNPVAISVGAKLDFNNYTLTYKGGGNAAISLASGQKLTLSSADGLIDGGVEVESDSSSVKVGTADFGVLKLASISGSASRNTLFNKLNYAMYKLDQEGEVLTYTKDSLASDGVLSYTRETGKEFRLEGLTGTSGISIAADHSFSLKAANFDNATIANGGNYTFNLSGDNSTSKTLTGSSSSDTIESSVAQLKIYAAQVPTKSPTAARAR